MSNTQGERERGFTPTQFLELLELQRRFVQWLITAMQTRAELRTINAQTLADETIVLMLKTEGQATAELMPDKVQAIELWPCGYQAQCRVKNCRARATTIAQAVDAGGRPRNQYELCGPHAEQIAERERAKGREIVRREVGR